MACFTKSDAIRNGLIYTGILMNIQQLLTGLSCSSKRSPAARFSRQSRKIYLRTISTNGSRFFWMRSAESTWNSRLLQHSDCTGESSHISLLHYLPALWYISSQCIWFIIIIYFLSVQIWFYYLRLHAEIAELILAEHFLSYTPFVKLIIIFLPMCKGSKKLSSSLPLRNPLSLLPSGSTPSTWPFRFNPKTKTKSSISATYTSRALHLLLLPLLKRTKPFPMKVILPATNLKMNPVNR